MSTDPDSEHQPGELLGAFWNRLERERAYMQEPREYAETADLGGRTKLFCPSAPTVTLGDGSFSVEDVHTEWISADDDTLVDLQEVAEKEREDRVEDHYVDAD